MNRRKFFSLLAGAAGAPLVPWRGLIEPVIILASPSTASAEDYMNSSKYAWFLKESPAFGLAPVKRMGQMVLYDVGEFEAEMRKIRIFNSDIVQVHSNSWRTRKS